MHRFLQEFLFLFVFALPAFVLPGILGPLLMYRYRQDRISQVAGWFTLKPLAATPLWILMIALGDSLGVPFRITQAFSWLPGFGLTLLLIWWFRKSIRQEIRASLLFVIADALRWLNAFVAVAAAKSLSGKLDLFYFMGVAAANLYALMALVIMWVREKREESRIKAAA